jgi:sugar-specific transcriptional regulator TrmB
MPAALLSSIKSIGLSIGETVVLGVLLRGGAMYASKIAKEARLNRTTTYGVLNELIEKGLVSKVKARNATQFQSIAPELLPDYIARKREELREREKELRDAIPQILLMRNKANVLPKVQFFEGVEGVKQAYEDTLENNKNGKLQDITGVAAVFDRLGAEWTKYYMEKRTEMGIRCTDLVPDSEWARKSREDDKKYLRVTKFLPPEYGFEAEIALYDNKVGIFSYAKENPVALIIEDDTISDAMRKIYALVEEKSSRE